MSEHLDLEDCEHPNLEFVAVAGSYLDKYKCKTCKKKILIGVDLGDNNA
jgi:hypothetical protein